MCAFTVTKLQDHARPARLLASIAARGIELPPAGVDSADDRFLVNGFKRYRCAQKLGIQCVTYLSLGSDEATANASLSMRRGLLAAT